MHIHICIGIPHLHSEATETDVLSMNTGCWLVNLAQTRMLHTIRDSKLFKCRQLYSKYPRIKETRRAHRSHQASRDAGLGGWCVLFLFARPLHFWESILHLNHNWCETFWFVSRILKCWPVGRSTQILTAGYRTTNRAAKKEKYPLGK